MYGLGRQDFGFRVRGSGCSVCGLHVGLCRGDKGVVIDNDLFL